MGPVPVLAQFVYLFMDIFVSLLFIFLFSTYFFFYKFYKFYYFLLFIYVLIHLSIIRFLSLSPNPFFLVSFFLSTHALNKKEP